MVHTCRCLTVLLLVCAVCSAPFPLELNKEALFKVRGDLFAGAIKLHEENLSISAEVQLLVDEKDGEEIWNLTQGDDVEVGPFRVSAAEDSLILQGCMLHLQ